MSIAFSGCRTRSAGLISAIAKQLKLVNLKPLTKVTVRFDPFHDKVIETRDFLFYISSPKVAATNVTCSLKTEIACDRSEPTITCDFETDEKLIVKTENLTALEILNIFNKHISSRVKPVEEAPVLTKQKPKKR